HYSQSGSRDRRPPSGRQYPAPAGLRSPPPKGYASARQSAVVTGRRGPCPRESASAPVTTSTGRAARQAPDTPGAWARRSILQSAGPVARRALEGGATAPDGPG